MASSNTAAANDTLEEVLDQLNDPGSPVYSLCEVEPLGNNGVRVFLNAPVAEELIELIDLGGSYLYAENCHTLHILP